MSWQFKVHADVPDVIISKRGLALLDRIRQDVGDWRARKAYANGIVYEPLISAYMLQPQGYSNYFQWPASYYDAYPGTVEQQWITVHDCWGEYGTYWLCRREAVRGGGGRGRWAVYLKPGAATLAKDTGVYYDMYLMPPSGNPTHGRLNGIIFYPRVDPNYSVTDSDNIPRYWAPYRCILYNDRFVLQEISGDPTTPPAEGTAEYYLHYQTVYEHSFQEGLDMAVDFYCKRQRIMFLPIREDQLIVKADFLKDGGFVYRTDLTRDGFNIFNEGVAGVVVDNAGSVFMQIVPVRFPDQGVFYSGVRQVSGAGDFTAGDATVSVETSAPASGGYIVGYSICDVYGNAFDPADVVDEFRYRLQIDVTDNRYTPTVDEVSISWDTETTSKSFSPSYIEDDIMSLEESSSVDQRNLTVRMVIRDPDGTYESWADRTSIAFDYDWVETTGDDPPVETTTHRAMLYLDEVSYDKETPALEIVCRDGWRRLDEILLGDVPKGDGKKYTDYVRELLLWGGWPAEKISFVDQNGDPYEDAIELPEANAGSDPAYMPQPGTSFTEFFARLHEEFAPEDIVYIDGDGVFTIVKGDGYTPSIKRTFYWTHEEAESAGDWYATIDKNSWSEGLLVKDFRNLIWVVGALRGDTPIMAYYADEDSVINESADNYTGEWRMMIYINSALRTQEAVNWVCRSLAHQYGRVRRVAEFTSHFYPDLRVGDFISIDDTDVTYWQITSMRYSITPSTLYIDEDGGERVAKCTYSVKEWVGRYG